MSGLHREIHLRREVIRPVVAQAELCLEFLYGHELHGGYAES